MARDHGQGFESVRGIGQKVRPTDHSGFFPIGVGLLDGCIRDGDFISEIFGVAWNGYDLALYRIMRARTIADGVWTVQRCFSQT